MSFLFAFPGVRAAAGDAHALALDIAATAAAQMSSMRLASVLEVIQNLREAPGTGLAHAGYHRYVRA